MHLTHPGISEIESVPHVHPRRSRLQLLTAITVAGLLFTSIGCKRGGGAAALQRLTKSNDEAAPTAPAPAKFGGQESLQIRRLQSFDGQMPEFTSMTVLPGRGMDVIAIKANIPGHGDIEILSVPSAEQIAAAMTGKDTDSNGEANVLGAAFLAPFTSPLAGPVSADGKMINANVHGRTIPLPIVADADGISRQPMARYGLLHRMSAQPLISNMPDGGEIKTVYDAGNFGGHWPGKIQITVSTMLSGRAVDLVMTARNDGPEAVPIGLGWYPRLNIPSGKRAQARLRLPIATQVLPLMPGTALSGEIKSDAGYNIRGGKELGSDTLANTISRIKTSLFDNGPTAELRDPASDYGIRIVGVSTSINGMRVVAPSDKNWVGIALNANPTDPSGKPLDPERDGNQMLDPGKTIQWRLRMELFLPSTQLKPAGL